MAALTPECVQAMRDAGLDVVEMAGWQGRGEPGRFELRGILLHHDAMGLHNDNVPRYMSQDGNLGSQLWIKYTGQVYILAAGNKSHAGSGRGFGNIPANNGNTYCIGIETDYLGSGPRPVAIDKAIHILTRVLVQHYGMDPHRDLALHREYAPDRKIDLANFDANAWRTIAAGDTPENHGTAADKPDAPAEEAPELAEDDDMLQTVQAADGPNSGTIFAVGPGHWHGLTDIEVYKQGVDAGLFKPAKAVANQRALDVIRAVALQLTEGDSNISVAK